MMVDMEVPSAYVEFLASMLPGKPRAELYTALGLQKHGKTLFYRDFLHHLKHSTDDFVMAPGIRGLVMIVFTLPSYPYVFKVIRDTIAPSKNIDRQTVKDKYMLVKRHDRVGRLADTLEYTDVAFPRARFTPELVAELQREAASLFEQDADTIVVKHLYIERRMTPLNLYLDQAAGAQLEAAVLDYGNGDQGAGLGQHLPGRHAVQELRRHARRARRVLRLRRDHLHDGDQLPPHPAAPHSGGRAVGGTLVSCGGQRRVSRGVRAVPAHRRQGARRVPGAARRSAGAGLLERGEGAGRGRADRGCIPLSGGGALRTAVLPGR